MALCFKKIKLSTLWKINLKGKAIRQLKMLVDFQLYGRLTHEKNTILFVLFFFFQLYGRLTRGWWVDY